VLEVSGAQAPHKGRPQDLPCRFCRHTYAAHTSQKSRINSTYTDQLCWTHTIWVFSLPCMEHFTLSWLTSDWCHCEGTSI